MNNSGITEFERMKDCFYAMREIKPRIKILVIENTIDKEYLIMDSADDFNNFHFIPFGTIFSELLNDYLKASNESVHHNTFVSAIKESNPDSVNDIVQRLLNRSSDVKNLIHIIKNRDTFKWDDKVALQCAYVRDWKRYRYVVYREWHELEDGEIDFLHQGITQNIFIPYDTVFYGLGKWLYGKAWFAESWLDIFSQDLYHVMVDRKVELPRFCPRCGLMFYSNNNKSKYCPDCKKESSDIRKENIKKNPARYLHKRVWDKINAHKDKYDRDFLNAFMNESNYYWYQISGKKSTLEKLDTYQNIDTIEKYQEWLKNKLNSL